MRQTEREIFEYSDYREYLKDFYVEQKRAIPSYSFRVFARSAKLGSPNYLKLVIDGQRRITDQNLAQFVRGLKLSKLEAKYFASLVAYQECGDPDAQAAQLERMNSLRALRAKRAQTALLLEKARLEIIKHWYHWAIREMVLLDEFREDPQWISMRLKQRVSPADVERSLELLLKLEFLQRKDGKLIQSEPLITTSDEISSHLIRELHRQFFALGVASINSDVMSEREINGLTIALDPQRIGEFKQMIKKFRKELNQTFSRSNGNTEVYHLTIGFFPLTGSSGKEKSS